MNAFESQRNEPPQLQVSGPASIPSTVGRAERCCRGRRRGMRVRRARSFAVAPLIALFALIHARTSLAADPRFTELPAFTLQPATNALKQNLAVSTNVQSNTVLSISPGVTNVSRTGSTNSMDTLDDKYKLAIGDRLSFRILEDEEEPKPLFVTDSGDLELPYIGRSPAVGKTCKQLARELKTELEKEYYYQATIIIAVDLMTKSRGKVYLVGPVRAPGPQEIPSDEVLTLSKAILRAGGFSDFADKRNVRVTRKGNAAGREDKTFIVNVTEILEKGKTDADLALEPGDFIYIPERSIRF